MIYTQLVPKLLTAFSYFEMVHHHILTGIVYQNAEMPKNTSGGQVFLIQFFTLNSNLESELKNFRHVFFKSHFKI